MNRGITGTPIQPRSTPIQADSFRFIKNTARGGCRGTTGLNRTSTVSNLGWIVSIRRSTVTNRSAAVMNRSGTVDESYRHRRSIVGHSIDAGFFFHSECPRLSCFFYSFNSIKTNPKSNGFIYLGTALPADSRVCNLPMRCGRSSSGHDFLELIHLHSFSKIYNYE